MQELTKIIQAIADAGGIAFQVGGCVRDQLLQKPNKDVDIEVFHLDAPTLSGLLSRFGKVSEVGVSFGVIKLTTFKTRQEIDFTLPRRESKVGRGHRGFQVEVDHTMTVHEAALRRDFTINAIYRNAHTGELLDPHGGADDLSRGLLRATSDHFAEDPLRVLRGMQFAARFDARLTPETAEMCRSLTGEFSTLAVERIWTEWSKWAEKGTVPSRGLDALEASGWLGHFPELDALRGVPQDPQWHPEGDVWVHTRLVCDAAARIADREQIDASERTVLLLSALCHDLGKPATTILQDGRWKSPAHAAVGVPIAESFLNRIGCPLAIVEIVLPLVAEHLIHLQAPPTPRNVRRLTVRLEKASLLQLSRLVEADLSGRPPLPAKQSEAVQQMLELAKGMKIELHKPDRIVLGRHLLELDYAPAKWFGEVLDTCYEAQLDGEFETVEGGIAFLKKLISNRALN